MLTIAADVTYAAAAEVTLSDALYAAYRDKYHRNPANILDRIIAPDARAITIRLVPRP